MVDDRHRLTLPTEMAGLFCGEDEECILTKEQFGCLSLWSCARWKERIDDSLRLVQQKVSAGRLADRTDDLQLFGRLLSSRFVTLRLGERSRLVIPEGFRDFLAVEPNSEVMVIGAGLCIEIWHPRAWRKHLRRNMPRFSELFQKLSS